MSEEFSVLLAGEIDDRLVEAVVAKASAQRLQATLRTGQMDATQHLAFPSELIDLAALLVAFASLALQFHGERKKERSWTFERFQAELRSAMLAQGVLAFDVEDVSDYSALLDGKREPCVVQVRDRRSGALYVVLLGYDGTSSVLMLRSWNRASLDSGFDA